MSGDFEGLYQKVKPIVYRLQSQYHIRLWDRQDWEQEGMITLFNLIQSHPEVLSNEGRLYVYFKTKFSNYVKDVLRQQGSQKRRFNQMAYEEIGELSHCVGQKGLVLDDYVAYQDLLETYRQSLSPDKRRQLAALEAGERFKGRTALLRDLAQVMKAFR